MKRLIIVAIVLLLSGCATSNYSYKDLLRRNSDSKKRFTSQATLKKDNSIDSKKTEVRKKINIFRLHIKTKPQNAKIRILNIKPKFYNGIKLKKGKYLIEATKAGYITYKKWIYLDKDSSINITLRKKAKTFTPNGEIEWKRVKIPSIYSKYSMNLILDRHIGYSGNIIFYLPDYRLNWYDAKRFCSRLNFKGLKWRLPTTSERRKCLKVRKFYDLYTTDIFTTNKNRYPKDKKKFICVAYPKSIKDNYSLERTAQDIYQNIANKILGSKYKSPKRPTKPKLYDFKPPKKDEFETTDEYKKRIAKLKIKYRQKRESLLKEYARKLKIWKENDRRAKAKFDESIKRFKRLKNAGMLYSLQQALYIKYGIPVIANLKYDADKEIFDMDVVSLRVDKISIQGKGALKNASTEPKDKVYITKNGILIDYIVSPAWWHSRGVDLSNIDNFEHVALSHGAVVSNLLNFANKNIKDRDHIWIIVPNRYVKDGIYSVGDILLSPNGRYEHGHHTFYYDPSIRSNSSISRVYPYKKHIKVKVGRKYAKLFKKVVSNNDKFHPRVVFDIKNGTLHFKYIKEFKNMRGFLDFLAFDDAYSDPSKLKKYIISHKNSKYYKKAKKRYAELNRFYKGYEPKMPFYVEGCKGYYPSELILKVARKSLKNKNLAKDFTPNFWDKITWSGLCRKGLLSGRGYLKMSAKKGNLYIDFDDGYMKNGFFVGDVKVELHKHLRGAFWAGRDIKEKVRLDSYNDFVNYQKGF